MQLYSMISYIKMESLFQITETAINGQMSSWKIEIWAPA
jgi:hypothetical protein